MSLILTPVMTASIAGGTLGAAMQERAIHPDCLLLSKVQLGDESAMATLYDSHSRIVYSVALRVLHDVAAAEDVLQEVFLRIWRTPASFVTARGSLAGWLAVIARNRAIDVLRKRHPMDSVDDVPLQALDNIYQNVEHSILIERAKAFMSTMPKVQSDALEMAFFRGLTHAEIAELTELPLGTIKTRIRSALQALGTALRA